MNGRRYGRAPAWVRVAVGVLAVALTALLIALAVRLLSGALNLARGGDVSTGTDPQFAEPAEQVTRPPELFGEGVAPDMADDPSRNWNLGEQTPVDKTAEELSREASGEAESGRQE